MKNNKENSSAGGIGFLGLLTIVFITLKLTGVITWSWWWVLSPIWIPTAITVLIFIIAVIGATSVAVDKEKHRNRQREANRWMK